MSTNRRKQQARQRAVKERLPRVAEEVPDVDLLLPHLGGVGKDGPWD